MSVQKLNGLVVPAESVEFNAESRRVFTGTHSARLCVKLSGLCGKETILKYYF